MSHKYVVKPYEQVAWTPTKGQFWATCNAVTKEVIDVYEDREMAEAWVNYTNTRQEKNNG